MAVKKKVAAVCYRGQNEGAVQFLLVRTSRGDRWTFPKGAIERSDPTPWAAAAREALEEAGVCGEIDPRLLIVYSHLRGRTAGGQGTREVVAGYLLRVTDQSGPGEPGREPTWFAPTDALEAIRSNRVPEEFITELENVVAAAFARIAVDRAPTPATSP